eukprot:GHVT01008063.1.p1 GENE.GHVT01008063.1~~GHVT01008063.1.p1  ORF type:complete len:320 (-),score=58.48 GHVT01008063.1:1100-2059(-)
MKITTSASEWILSDDGFAYRQHCSRIKLYETALLRSLLFNVGPVQVPFLMLPAHVRRFIHCLQLSSIGEQYVWLFTELTAFATHEILMLFSSPLCFEFTLHEVLAAAILRAAILLRIPLLYINHSQCFDRNNDDDNKSDNDNQNDNGNNPEELSVSEDRPPVYEKDEPCTYGPASSSASGNSSSAQCKYPASLDRNSQRPQEVSDGNATHHHSGSTASSLEDTGRISSSSTDSSSASSLGCGVPGRPPSGLVLDELAKFDTNFHKYLQALALTSEELSMAAVRRAAVALRQVQRWYDDLSLLFSSRLDDKELLQGHFTQ